MAKVYAGIGSRRCPQFIWDMCWEIGYKFASLGWLLRSGSAEGCDDGFEQGVEEYAVGTDYGQPESSLRRLQEIYIPWNGFNHNYIDDSRGIYCIENDEKATELARKFHPAYASLSQGAKKLMARNCYQVLGSTLDDPVKMVICYTPDGATTQTRYETGGTGQAIRIAVAHNIPVYNLGNEEHFTRLTNWLKET